MTRPGNVWLAETAGQPDGVRRVWRNEDLAAISTGRAWLALGAPLLRSVDFMQPLNRAGQLGPMLAYPEADRSWWLVPLDAENAVADLPMLTVRPAGWRLLCPPADGYARGRVWPERRTAAGCSLHRTSSVRAVDAAGCLRRHADEPL
ncbi:hypothetical protein [Streptomyces sp. JJ38]|uniref:hypothetical protein n=1 Tax=Streptomyces sp. JJ38 TaxID=2738128 RepID=UPI00214AEDEE|nr:hypothetical protein [Streptomyces sp. JJ38]